MLLPASHDLGASAFTWPAALFLWGPGSWSDLHRHHCVQLVMALDGTLRFIANGPVNAGRPAMECSCERTRGTKSTPEARTC